MATNVIIGAGPAAINAIETIREFDDGASEIKLVCDEPAYARMVLPYHLADQIPHDQVLTADDDYYDKLKVTRHLGVRATKIDPKNNKVKLSDGQSLDYDNLLIATGSSPTMPPIQGVNLPGVHPLWTIENMDAVLQAARGKNKPEVVLVGAGFIGFIVLNAMYKRGWKLHVVEIADHVLPRMLNAPSANIVEAWLQNKNAALHLGTSVKEIKDASGRRRVELEDGSAIEADIVIIATGIKPNMDFLAGSGITTGEGILVNERMQTNYSNIYAAGDVAQGPDLLSDKQAIHAIQPTAVDHGRIAGANMAGHSVPYPGSLLMNILDVCGLQCASFGQWSGSGDALTINNPDRPVYQKLLWDEDRITGAIFLGQAHDAGMRTDVGMVKGIIQTQTPLGTWKDYLKENPFDIRRPYIAAKVGEKLVGRTLIGRPSRGRQYRFQNKPVGPQVTRPTDHQVYVASK